MNYLHKAAHALVCGKSGMGKTSFALRYINASHHKRVFIFDLQSEFSSRLQLDEKRVARTIEEIYEKAEQNRIVAYDPTNDFPGDALAGFETFCEIVYAIARDALVKQKIGSLVVTDELQKYVSHAYAPPSFKTILETGRKEMLDSLSLSRAPNRVNTGVREEFTELVLFRLDDVNSLKFAEHVGANVAMVQNLNEHEYLYYNVLTGREGGGKIEFAGKGSV